MLQSSTDLNIEVNVIRPAKARAREHAGVRWHSLASTQALQNAAYRYVLNAATRAIHLRGQFLVVLAGGDTPLGLYRMLRDATTDWSRWQVYFGDERCLPADNTRRNSTMVACTWLDHVPIPAKQVHIIPAELGASAGALAYAHILRNTGDFDLVALGLGEDGHTASLFPGHDWGLAPGAPDTLAVYDAPKSPSERISLSAARLSRTRCALFMIQGQSKREAVSQWKRGAEIPASAIQPTDGVDVMIEAMAMPAGIG